MTPWIDQTRFLLYLVVFFLVTSSPSLLPIILASDPPDQQQQQQQQQQQYEYGPQQQQQPTSTSTSTDQQQEQQLQEQLTRDTQAAYNYGLAGFTDSSFLDGSSSGGDYCLLDGTSSSSTTTTTGSSSTTTPPTLLVTIPSLGTIQGRRLSPPAASGSPGTSSSTTDFYGNIPFAAPPVGQLRFAPPEPPPPWAPVVLDGKHYGPDCWQLDDPVLNPGAKRDYMSEDCLSLNIFTPAGHVANLQRHNFKKSSRRSTNNNNNNNNNNRPGGFFGVGSSDNSQNLLLPVLIWLHGGAFQQGGARRPEYDGHKLAERNVIVVTLNYRLGALGFLVSSPDGITGNFGLMDQRAALHFVHQHIHHFGGDNTRVTLFGESAGAVMTGQHLMMEGAGTYLFQSAIMQSNPLGYLFRSVVIADFIGDALKRSVDCRDLECLRAERVEEIMLAQKSLMGVPRSVSDVFTWGPTLTQERNLHVGGSFGRSPSSSGSSGSSSTPSSSLSHSHGRRTTTVLPKDQGLLVDYDDIQHQRRRRNNKHKQDAKDAYAVNVTQPLKSLHKIPNDIPIIIGSNQHEGEMFIHSAFPITMSKPVYWMFVGALFRDSASRVLKHYRHYVEEIEADANELATKQVEEEENKMYYLEHQKQLEQEYEMLLALNASRVLRERDSGLEALVNTWSTGGGSPWDNASNNGTANAKTRGNTPQWYKNVFQAWLGQSQQEVSSSSSSSSKDDNDSKNNNAASQSTTGDASTNPHRKVKGRNRFGFTHKRIPPMHRIRTILRRAKHKVPFLQEKDPKLQAQRAAERELKQKGRAKQKALKEAAKVVVDYRPVMSRIINDYLFRCPSYHYAHVISRNRALESQNGTRSNSDGSMDDSRASSSSTKSKKDKRSRNNNNVYVYRFSQPTHIPGYKECWGKSCHTAELPYVFEAMSIIRSHYSTLGPFAQAQAPVPPEYPYTDMLTAYQGALEEMEEDDDLFLFDDDESEDDVEEEDLMWKGSNNGKTNDFGRGGDQLGNADGFLPSSSSSLSRSSLHSSSSRSQKNNNVPESKSFQRVLKSMFGDYFIEDADFSLAADMAERWVSFAKNGDPNYEGGKADWLPWRYLPSTPTADDENSEIPWQPQDFEYMDDELEDEDEYDDDPASPTSGFQWSEDRAERIYRQRALKALGMEVIEEDMYRTELRRMPTASEFNEMEAVFTFLFGNAKSNSRRRRQQKDDSGGTKMSKRAIRQVQQIAQAMGVVGTGLRGESSRPSSSAQWDDNFFPEMLDLKWPPEGRLVERDCTCDMWERIRYRY